MGLMSPETLEEVIRGIGSFDRHDSMFVRDNVALDAGTPTVVASPDRSIAETGGYRYLLEIDLALDVLAVWTKWRGREPSTAEAVSAVLYYALNDAYEPVP